METSHFKEKEKKLLDLFLGSDQPEKKYRVLVDLGQKLPKTKKESFSDADIVEGCQSLMFLKGKKEGVNLYFEVYSEALISSGLAYLLINFYNGETPEIILKTPPSFLTQLDIAASLTPGRSNGLAALYHKIRSLCVYELYKKN
jgi:cysteine desulfuration protein SufE